MIEKTNCHGCNGSHFVLKYGNTDRGQVSQRGQQPKYAAVDSKQVISQLILLFSVQITQNLVPEMTKTQCTRDNPQGLVQRPDVEQVKNQEAAFSSLTN